MTRLMTLLLATVTFCTSADDSLTESGLSLEMIMADPEWIGTQPRDPFISYDGTRIYFTQKRAGSKISDWYQVDVATKAVSKLAFSPLDSANRLWNAARDHAVFVREGDLYLIAGDKPRALTQTVVAEHSPVFSPDSQNIIYQVDQQVFQYNVERGFSRQLGTVAAEDDPLDSQDKHGFLDIQQRELMTTLTKEAQLLRQQAQHRANTQATDPNQTPPPVYLGKDVLIRRIAASSTGKQLLVTTVSSKHEGGKRTSMPNYVSDDGYTVSRDVRAKVGIDIPPDESLWLVNLEDRSKTRVDVSTLPGIKNDPLKKLRQSALKWHIERGADEEKIRSALKAPEVRSARLESAPKWNESGTQVAVMLHANDNKDRWLVTIAGATGELKVQHRLTRNEGWINYANNNFDWLDDSTLWFLSEESGYPHLYSKALGKRQKQLTKGAFVVSSPQVAPDKSSFYFIANVDNPSVYHLHRVPVTGGSATAVTGLFTSPDFLLSDGTPAFELSPDGAWFRFKHAATNQPPEIHIQQIASGQSSQLTTSVSQQYSDYPWIKPQLIDVASSHFDGTIRSRLYTPTQDSNTRPAVVFVHGAGYLQNAHEGWSNYFREYMFHTLLVEHGFVVLDMDYRGSRGYGADWREAIYRQMGHPELEDLKDGVQYLIDNQNVDPDRIGVYGGSYGGFMTFMAMFRSPETFAAGASLRPVTDWAHYNHYYTSNILNTPTLDPEAYTKSSPMYFAENYNNRPMLIAHGMQDSNVHYQDSVRLVQRLIELKKENFELATYPLDPHGFKYATSWLDEYRRIFKLFKQELGTP